MRTVAIYQQALKVYGYVSDISDYRYLMTISLQVTALQLGVRILQQALEREYISRLNDFPLC